MNLTQEQCASNPSLLSSEERQAFLSNLRYWHYDPEKKCIHRSFQFQNFHEVMAFLNAMAWIAHQENHHPDVQYSYSSCTLAFQTHTVRDVSQNDFICAAKVNALLE